ncbi:hypothetical protein EVAR_19407_1 [Eumeta japonica]|uniref:Uncharacterized protein n=1 Tax=Eumeta variegata TaxID=151549 RepID=A0A4C1TRK1_EUMVA|nr:hypothetical protein EVAR_19407_1 [Eumeta japonica]
MNITRRSSNTSQKRTTPDSVSPSPVQSTVLIGLQTESWRSKCIAITRHSAADSIADRGPSLADTRNISMGPECTSCAGVGLRQGKGVTIAVGVPAMKHDKLYCKPVAVVVFGRIQSWGVSEKIDAEHRDVSGRRVQSAEYETGYRLGSIFGEMETRAVVADEFGKRSNGQI